MKLSDQIYCNVFDKINSTFYYHFGAYLTELRKQIFKVVLYIIKV